MAEEDLENELPDTRLKKLFNWWEGTPVPPTLGALMTVIGCIVVGAIAAATLWLIGRFVYTVFTYTVPAEDDLAGLRNLALMLAAVIGAPFVVWRSLVAHWQARTAEQGLITSRITQAVQQLGAEKTVKTRIRTVEYPLELGGIETRKIVQRASEDLILPESVDNYGDVEYGEWVTNDETVPNLEVRLGAIYAPERIAQDSARDHIPIMETLCAYIRENSNARPPQDHSLPDWESLADDADAQARAAHEAARTERFGEFYFQSKAREWAQALPQPRADIQAALTVLGRRGDDAIRREAAADRPYRLDLRAANLQRADLSGLALGPALLGEARMEGADLRGARMEGADLGDARMEGAQLFEVRMEGANLGGARMEGANLGVARMEGANLGGARMEGALLSKTGLKSTDLRADSIRGSALRSVDLTEVSHFSPELFLTAFGDGSIILPEGVARPDHWPADELDDDEFFGRWRRWREAQNLPWPPLGRTLDHFSHYDAIPPD